jgi:hypothetical protein
MKNLTLLLTGLAVVGVVGARQAQADTSSEMPDSASCPPKTHESGSGSGMSSSPSSSTTQGEGANPDLNAVPSQGQTQNEGVAPTGEPESQHVKAMMTDRLLVTAGAGITDFTGTLGSHTNLGFGWRVRGAYDFNRNVGVEGNYVGAHNAIDDTRVSSTGVTTTGFNGDIKLQAPIGSPGGTELKPYIFGGLGGSYYGVSHTAFNPIYGSSAAFQVPIGLGGDAYLSKDVTAGVRLDYMLNSGNRVTTEGGGNQYGITASLGVHY